MIWNFLEKYRDIGLLIIRFGFGFGFFWFHGKAKLMGGPERWAQIGDTMQLLGIDFWHTFFGFLAAFSESIGGLMIVTGFLFRPAAAMLGFTMLMALMSHLISGQGNPGHAFKNLFALTGLIIIGPGKYSLDFLIKRKLDTINQ
ncbi:DoxX family protein [candidate division KSB1 bacterium]|nr:DoxX family protein [candidate division KSB1 bacterium]